MNINNVYYTYGSIGDTNNCAGRIASVEDASGWQKFEYGKLGEITKNLRTFALPYENEPYTFIMEFEYDSWNRIQRMTYPDGEVVSYGYNLGGMLNNITGVKNNVPYKYIESIRYNEFEMRDAVYYGNGTKAFYKYDVLQRLDNLRSETFFNENMQDIDYKYDAVSNITDIVNNAGILSNGLGGKFNNRYRYDDMYRLVYSEGAWHGNHPVSYELEMEYMANGRILKKYMQGDSYEQTPYSGNQTPVHYDNDYHYTNTNQPNTLTNIDNGPHQNFKWDAKGNLIFHYNEAVPFKRFLCWDEQNRLQGVKEEKHYSYYQYDANGERVYKLTGKNVRQNRNGERRDYYHAGSTMLYASPYLVSNGKYYTKHYYAENERVASKIGGGGLSVIDTNDDPEMFGIHQDRSNDHFERVQACLDAQVYVEDSPLQLLYTWREIVQEETECYWYHPDHLGSSSWITFTDGSAVQHLHYLPWGEDFVSQRSTNWHTMYTFSAKEKDAETGYSYFGSRYYNSDLSIWLSVDSMSDKYPSLSPYTYCANNPIKLVDPNGEDIWEIDESGKLTWKGKNDELDILNATKTGQSMEFPVGTIKEMTPDKGKAKHPVDGVFDFDFNYIDINDDELAECFFEFAAENTSVEWSHTKYSETGNRIATATNMPYDLADPTGLKITYDFVKKGIKVRESNHSHPFIEGENINPKPSGEDVSSKYSLIEFCKNHKSSVPTTKVYGKVDGDWKYTTY